MKGANTPGADSRGASEAEPIALVGIGCRFADARGPEEFWRIVRDGVNTVREVPQHRIDLGYDIDHYYDPRPCIPGKVSSRLGGFLEHPELFDPAAYGLSPRDAVNMEPQQRLMIEVAWDALEDAGIRPEDVEGRRVAVIVGHMAEDYSRERTALLGEEATYRGYDVFTVGGMSRAVLSGRIAFLLGVTGPSFTLDTACSSSLIATHLACESLRRGESETALAGGVNLFLTPEGNIALSRSGMLAQDGKCKAFDAAADGFVRAEGAGMVVLRRLSDAIADGNPIYAVIRGTGISTDGRDGGHMMAPGRHGQAQAMHDAYAGSGVDPSEIQYVETHGTGTTIGDPVEIAALAEVMGPGRDPDRPLLVGSAKGNFGHSESASGMAGLIKAALSIHHRTMPGQLHFNEPSPQIPWDEVPVRVQAETIDWPVRGPALVGVNSFGISGTNAHVILESAPEGLAAPEKRAAAARPSLLSFTALDPRALDEMARSHRDRLAETCGSKSIESESRSFQSGADPAVDLVDLGYTLGCRKTKRPHRLALVAGSAEEAIEELDAFLDGRASGASRVGAVTGAAEPGIVMVFPGQGGQWLGMGRELFARESCFRSAIEEIGSAYDRFVDWSLEEVVEGRAKFDWRRRLDVLQPLLVATQVALASQWASWGIRPSRVIGQSMGEIAAARVAGCLDLETMARLACERGRVVASASSTGGMGVVAVPAEELRARLAQGDGRVEWAGSNSPTTSIVSGDRVAVQALIADFEARGIFARPLDVDFASHCFHMDPLLDDFAARLDGLHAEAGSIPFVSAVDGRVVEGVDLDARYWVRNLRAPVAFTDAMDASLAMSAADAPLVHLEVSPHPTMARPIAEIAEQKGIETRAVASLQRDQDEQRALLSGLAELHVAGVEIDFRSLFAEGRHVATPLYPYQRRRYWFGERTRTQKPRPRHPWIGSLRESAVDSRLRIWDLDWDADAASWFREHCIDGEAYLPSTLAIELGLAAATQLWPGESVGLSDLEFRRSDPLPSERGTALQVVVTCVDSAEHADFQLLRRDPIAGAWRCVATAVLEAGTGLDEAVPSTSEPTRTPLATDVVWTDLEAGGIEFGRLFKTLKQVETLSDDSGNVLGWALRCQLARVIDSEWHAFHAHPLLLESGLQILSRTMESPAPLALVSVERVQVPLRLGSECRCEIRPRVEASPDSGSHSILADLVFVDREGTVVARIDGLCARPMRAPDARSASVSDLHRMGWKPFETVRGTLEPQIQDWILVSDSTEQAEILASDLEKEGHRSLFCEKVEEIPSLVADLRRRAVGAWGLILLGWADRPVAEPGEHLAYRIANWADAIRSHCADSEQVWIVTRGLQDVDAEPSPRPRVWGSLFAAEVGAHVSGRELDRCRVFDASGDATSEESTALVDLIGTTLPDRIFAARGTRLLVPRLEPENPLELGKTGSPGTIQVRAGDRNFRVEHSALEGAACSVLRGAPCEPRSSQSEHIEVRVEAAALSQLDVLTSLGMARPGGGQAERGVGHGFAGVVIGVGENDSEFSVGDRVMGWTPGAAARRISVERSRIVHRPDALDPIDVARILFPALIARSVLDDVARVRAGDSLLIHRGLGNVGRAVAQLARAIGVEVEILSDGEPSPGGADYVFVASDGAALHDALAHLRPGGRLIDLCARGDFDRAPLPALRLAPNQGLLSVDFLDGAVRDPQRAAGWLRDVAEDLEAGRLQPWKGMTFRIDQAARALRALAQKKADGGVVLDLAEASDVEIEVAEHEAPPLAAGEAVWVLGERSAGTHELATWMIEAWSVHAIPCDASDMEIGLARIESGAESAPAALVHLACAEGDTHGIGAAVIARAAALGVTAIAQVWRRDRNGGAGDCRAWEIRAVLDPLWLAGLAEHTATSSLSVASETPPEVIGRRLEEAFRRRGTGHQRILTTNADETEEDSGSPLFASLRAESGDPTGAALLRDRLHSLSGGERRQHLERFVMDALAGVLGLGEQDRAAIDSSRGLDSLGLDSLMSMEVFAGLSRDLDLEIARDWFDSAPSIRDIAAVLSDRLEA